MKINYKIREWDEKDIKKGDWVVWKGDDRPWLNAGKRTAYRVFREYGDKITLLYEGNEVEHDSYSKESFMKVKENLSEYVYKY